ncbi:MAG: phosphoadenosine phosphosulfate reductase family protein, partial [Chloroflexaceae bacterium]|nr:phosphoadenosine phosphosulfate reductase family protein [Chloroflexaceae bacterium]
MNVHTTIAPTIPYTAAPDLTDLNAQFAEQPAEALLRWAAATYADAITLTCSFGGPSGVVLLDMVVRGGFSIPVTFLDTDLLFPETYALVEQVEQHYGIIVQRQRPALSMPEQDQQEGPALYERNPDRCCTLRKVLPLHDALQPYQAWITGLRRDQSEQRSDTHRAATGATATSV